ncbi:MAG TPA: EF-hand domain-containing protein [Gemmataceae bacterium]|jgi:Ca2+-binding EF-hand superfamily protein
MNALALGLTAWLIAAEPPPAVKGDTQDFVFLAEARPVLVRVQVRIDGRPLQAARDDFMKHLFAHLDLDGDGVLNKEEVERVPAPNQLLGGGFAALIGATAAPKRETLDADKDGKVTPAELSAYYRKNGFELFQFQLNPNDSAARAQLAYLGGAPPDPEVAAVSKAIFSRLDADKDGKLSAEELAAAPDTLLRLDENEDEIVTAAEMVPDAKPPSAMAMMAGRAKPSSTGGTILVPIPTAGRPPTELARHMQQRYGNGKKESKLDRKALGLDEATFANLDADKDGLLDANELNGFVKRAPDLCVTVHFGANDKAKTPVELTTVDGRMPALADKVKTRDGLLLLDLGATRVQLHRRDEENNSDRLMDFVRPQLIAQFKAADTDGNGVLDAAEAKKGRFFGGIFKAMDRDNDGKVTEKEFLAYLDKAQDLRKRAEAACATLVLRDQSRGLFSLLDADGDGRLSVREMRQAPKLLRQLDRQGKGHLRPEDLPHIYRLTLRRGPASAENNQEALFIQRYLSGYREEASSARGPAWFRKMDRNRDGDVSRREFLFSDEQFRRLDTDGDGLISVEEAEKASAPSSRRIGGSEGLERK